MKRYKSLGLEHRNVLGGGYRKVTKNTAKDILLGLRNNLIPVELTATDPTPYDKHSVYIYSVCPYCGAPYIEDNKIKHITTCLECSKGTLIKGIKSAYKARKLSRKGLKHFNVINRRYRNNIDNTPSHLTTLHPYSPLQATLQAIQAP